jgi:tRNA dimethylallyltransferase
LKPLLVIIGGPTGIGKTTTAIKIARYFNTEILSSDSRQFFKEMSIGTAVPSKPELQSVPHHFIHNLSVKESYNASQYEEDSLTLLREKFKSHSVIVMVGGSGLYIDAVCRGIDYLPTIPPDVRKKYDDLYLEKGIEEIRFQVKTIDPAYYEKVDKQNHKRMLKALEVYDITGLPYSTFLKNKEKERDFDTLLIVLDMNREELYSKINKRVDLMIEEGLEEEARSVIPYRNSTPLKTVGYKELFEYFDGNITFDEAITQIKNHTRAYARRQLTWFRRYKEAHWFSPTQTEEIINLIQSEKSNR